MSDFNFANTILWQRITANVRQAEAHGELLKQARASMEAAGLGTPAALAWWSQVHCGAADVAASLASARMYTTYIKHDFGLQQSARKLIDKTRKSIPVHD